MKKTLLALATLSAMAGSALAADVTVYGLVDYGFKFTNVDQLNGGDSESTFEMKSSMNSGSRFGLKGSEDLGNGLKVGFVLENGFNADDGTLDNGGRLFGRESQLYVQGSFGTVSFGRMGQILSALGTYGLLGNYSVFGGGWGSYTGGKFVHGGQWGRLDNAFTYASPEFAGLKIYAQYSFKADSSQKDYDGNVTVENKGDSDRMATIAATYNYGGLSLLAAWEQTFWANVDASSSESLSWIPETDDGYNGYVAGTYDFGIAKIYATGQYFKRQRTRATDWKTVTGLQGVLADYVPSTLFVDGYAASIGADVPAFGGTFKTDIGYRYNECIRNPDNDLKTISLSLGYVYNLSKRTTVYGAGTYVWQDLGKLHTVKDGSKEFKFVDDPRALEILVGMIHKF